MGFVEAVQSVFQNYVNFSGRARRSEFWYFTLFTVIVNLVFGLLGSFSPRLGSALSGIFSLAILIPSLSVSWRRLHDIGRSGLWNFIVLVPIVGWVILLVWCCKDSDPDTNEYGICPK